MNTHPLLAGLHELRRNWFWFLLLGIALIILGMIMIGAALAATIVSMVIFGWLLVISGAFEAIAAFGSRAWSGFFLHLLSGVLSLVVGVLVLAHPLAAAEGLTLLIAAYLLVAGIFRMAAALSVRYPHWGWELLGGLVTTLLGALIWAQWPVSGLWVIGTFLGIDLLFRGWAWVMFSVAVRQFLGSPPAAGPGPTAPPGPP